MSGIGGPLLTYTEQDGIDEEEHVDPLDVVVVIPLFRLAGEEHGGIEDRPCGDVVLPC
jgi:hypothetical protein